VVLILNMIALMDRFTRGRADANGPRMAGLLSNAAQTNVQTKTSSGAIHTRETKARGTAGGQA
jgi:hypothetical protein